MIDVLNRSELLKELGYGHPDAARAAVDLLVAAGLTNEKKVGIAANKKERCRAILSQALVRLCGRCMALPRGDARPAVPALEPRFCEVCQGSPNRLAVRRAAEVFRRKRLRRLVVVGGAPGVHKVLEELWPDDLELRIVSGTERHTGESARTNLGWGDAVAVWGSTELNHKVSLLYTRNDGVNAHKVFTVHRRGIEALAQALLDHLASG